MRLMMLRGAFGAIAWQRALGIGMALLALAAAALAWLSAAALSLTEPVVVTTRDIAPGARLTAAMLTTTTAPRNLPEMVRGFADPRMLIGMYARAPLRSGQLVTPADVQATPPDEQVFWDKDRPAPQVLRGVVFELSSQGVGAAHPGGRVNVLALIDAKRGADPAFSVGAFDAPGSGARAVRVVRNAPVLEVEKGVVRIEVTAEQSRFLWALAAADVPFVGEVTADPQAPLGPLRPRDLPAAAALAAPAPPAAPTAPAPPATPAAPSAPPATPAAPPARATPETPAAPPDAWPTLDDRRGGPQ
jgi:hypothetical protein